MIDEFYCESMLTVTVMIKQAERNTEVKNLLENGHQTTQQSRIALCHRQ